MHNDQQFLAEAKKDPHKFELLYKKYIKKIYNYFWYRVGQQKEIAEDLTQDTFFKAFRSLASYKDQGYSYYTYLQTIAHNILANYYRTPRAIPLESIGDIPIEIIGKLNRKIEADMLWLIIQRFPSIEKNTLNMFYKQDLPIKYIAQTMGKSTNAIKLILSRSRKYLREKVKD